MEAVIKKIIKRLYPELESGLHTPKHAVVLRIPNPPEDQTVSTNIEPRYAVDVQMLDIKGNLDNKYPIYESVPIALNAAGDTRGFFGLPQPGTVVVIEFAYASPEHPYISNVLPIKKRLPDLEADELLIQRKSSHYLKASQNNNWEMVAPSKIWIGNQNINLLNEVRRLADILKGHTHPGVGTPSQASQIENVEKNVKTITKEA